MDPLHQRIQENRQTVESKADAIEHDDPAAQCDQPGVMHSSVHVLKNSSAVRRNIDACEDIISIYQGTHYIRNIFRLRKSFHAVFLCVLLSAGFLSRYKLCR